MLTEHQLCEKRRAKAVGREARRRPVGYTREMAVEDGERAEMVYAKRQWAKQQVIFTSNASPKQDMWSRMKTFFRRKTV